VRSLAAAKRAKLRAIMRVALLYPPPWKLPARGQSPLPPELGGPPRDFREGDLDADFYQTPYGLFSLGAQARRAGHPTKVMNLSAFDFASIEALIPRLDADVFGMSCWTANRRGVGLLAELIRKHHPEATIVIGGPHATPLAKEMLAHHPGIDLVCVGESDATFLEVLERLGRREPLTEIAGTVYRVDGRIERGPSRPAIHDLDTLASPHEHFDTHIVMTSRGCPWACTFCGAETSWGRGFRGHSVGYVLDALEQLVPRLRVKMVQIKDDTFTTNKKRVIELCRGIRARKLNFLWSCDTRVDVLNEELLREMRLAGCQRLSLGVESGSQQILDQIHKKITKEEIIRAAQMAKKFGIHVRFYMMLGNRGETAETFRETLAFLEAARPHQYIFSCLSIYPGTADFHDAEAAGWLDRELYFTGDFQELKVPYDAPEDVTRLLSEWFAKNRGLREGYLEGVEECRQILAELGEHHAAHLDLGAAYLREGELELAEQHVRRAIELEFPAPGLCYNYLGVIAQRRGDLERMQDELMRAARSDPQHYVLIQNVQAARAWFRDGGGASGAPLNLVARHDFQLFERTQQPTLPGPLPDNCVDWEEPVPAADSGELPDAASVQRIDVGNESLPFRSRRLPML
jgi:anaerobic magnesium-protoporphyrin IX monomethyl ester cyclase